MIVSRELYTEVRFRHVWWCPHCMKVLNKGNNKDKVPCCGHYMLEAHDMEQMRKQGALTLLCSTGLMKERTTIEDNVERVQRSRKQLARTQGLHSL